MRECYTYPTKASKRKRSTESPELVIEVSVQCEPEMVDEACQTDPLPELPQKFIPAMSLRDVRHAVQHDHSYAANSFVPETKIPKTLVFPEKTLFVTNPKKVISKNPTLMIQTAIFTLIMKNSFPIIVIVMTPSQKRKIQTTRLKNIIIGLTKTAGISMKRKSSLYLRAN